MRQHTGMRRNAPAASSGLPVLDFIHSEALGGQALALSTAGAGPVPLRQLLPLQAHAQQVEAARAGVTQGQGAALWVVHLKRIEKKSLRISAIITGASSQRVVHLQQWVGVSLLAKGMAALRSLTCLGTIQVQLPSQRAFKCLW